MPAGSTTSTARRSRPAATAGTGRRPKRRSWPGRSPTGDSPPGACRSERSLFGYACSQQFRDRGRLPLRHSEQLPETTELGAEPDPEAARTVHTEGLLRAGRAYGRIDPRHIQAAARRHGRKRIGADLCRPADIAHGQLPPATVHRQAGGRHKGTADHGVPAIDGQVPPPAGSTTARRPKSTGCRRGTSA